MILKNISSVSSQNLEEMDLKDTTQKASEDKESLEKFENVFDQALQAKDRLEAIERNSVELQRERRQRDRRECLEWWLDVFKL